MGFFVIAFSPNSLELRRRGYPTSQEFPSHTPAPMYANHAASPVASSEIGMRRLAPRIRASSCTMSTNLCALKGAKGGTSHVKQ